jgi:hypothetical protein
MTAESDWVKSIAPRLQESLLGSVVKTGERLPYRHEVFKYKDTKPSAHTIMGYQTDILVRDDLGNGLWVPRVVIECKLASVTTHDALTYSAKADTHKQVHPYLRYGILIANHDEKGVPRRLFRHGAHFDFMAAWKAKDPSDEEWEGLIEVLREEIKTSRRIEEFVSQRSSAYSLVHRRLILKSQTKS